MSLEDLELMEEKPKKGIPYIKILFGIAAAVLIVMILTGQKTWFSEEPPVEFLSDMDTQFKVKPQVGSTFFADGKGERDVLPNTFPRGGRRYPLDKPDFDKADSVNGTNPIPASEFVLARGKNRFETMCAPCHGNDGQGNGMVVQRGFQNPPNLRAELTKSKSDGLIYHVISAGQNIMPSYADKLTPVDRWAVLHYVRQMQAEGVKEVAPAPTK